MTQTTPSRRSPRASALVATALAGLVFLLAACSGSDDAGTNGGDANLSAEAPADADQAARGAEPESGTDGAAPAEAGAPNASQTGNTTGTPVAQRAVISTATVSLSSDDVADARFDVQKIVDQVGGEIAEEQTEGGEDMRRSRLVIRVPSERFNETVAAFEKVGDLESSTRTSEDVTTKVIDTAARIRAQEESLRRVEILLARAQSIRDIVAIEAQLTHRQAELDSLKSQQAYLADQTSLSTIAVHIERTRDGKEKKEKDDTDETGFLSGLENGWDALTTFGAGVATVVGAVLPFAVVLAILGFPAWLLARRFGRRRTSTPAAPAAP
jgi:hypothetical protein